MSRSLLDKLENKKNKYPSLKQAYALAKILDKTVYDIWPDTTEIVEETTTITIKRIKK